MSAIPTLYLGRDGAGGMLSALEMLDRLVEGRIERQPDARHTLDTELRQCVGELPNDHPDSVCHGLNVRGLLGMRHGALEVVENGKEIPQEVFARLFLAFGLLAPRALAEVVEVRGGPEELIFEPSRLLARLLQRIDRSLWRRCCSRFGAHLRLGAGFAVRRF